MKKSILFCSIATLLVFTFCKKKDSTPAPAPSGTTTGGTTGGGASNSNMQTTYMITDYGNTITTDSIVFASFYATPPTSVAPTSVSAGTVSLNSTVLNPSNLPYENPFPMNINIHGSLNWNVTGSGTITAFTYSYLPSYPKYTGGNLLPDTCIKANGISIQISGVSNAPGASVSVILSQNTTIFKYILGTSGTVTFSAAELSSYSTNSPIVILIMVSNITSATLGGIKHGFSNSLHYTKYSYLK